MRTTLRVSITILLFASYSFGGTYYVSTAGSDSTGNGSLANPWATLTHASSNVPDDGSTVLVQNGTYNGRVRLNRRFNNHTVFRSANPYRARLVNSSAVDQVVTSFGGANFTFEGFEVTRPSASATGALLMQVQQATSDGSVPAEDIVIRNNIFHDSYNNDLLKINNVCDDIVVEGNVFYNQSGSDEHIDVNGVTDVVIQDNIFFNDFAGSGRTNNNDTGSYIVIKNSAALPLNERITVRRNVFLNWQGSTGSTFVLCGEDGQDFYEAEDVVVENNLMLGNSANTMRTAFGVKGARDITFRNNTISGDLPSLAFAMRLNLEGLNPQNQNIFFYNNIWSDPTGTMADFSDGATSETSNAVLNRNLYYNGGNAIPTDGDVLNYTADANAVFGNPQLGAQSGIVLPRWNSSGGAFVSGNATIRDEFVRLVQLYGQISFGSPAIGTANAAQSPSEDILGNARDSSPDLGAFEAGGSVLIVVTPATLPSATQNSAYSQSFGATGGAGPYSFSVTAGSLPSGLTLSAAGLLSGTPSPSGTFNFTVTAMDQNSDTGSRAYQLPVQQDCLLCDDFNDGVRPGNWTYSKTWSESGGFLTATTIDSKAWARATPALAACSNCVVNAVLQSSGGSLGRVWLHAFYVNNKTKLELQMHEAKNFWLLKYISNGVVTGKRKFSQPVAPNTNYRVRIQKSAGNFQLYVDDVLLGTVPFTGNPSGIAGFQVSATTGRFDSIEVR